MEILNANLLSRFNIIRLYYLLIYFFMPHPPLLHVQKLDYKYIYTLREYVQNNFTYFQTQNFTMEVISTHTNGSTTTINGHHHNNGKSDHRNGDRTTHENGNNKLLLRNSNFMKPGWFSEFSALWPGWD